LPPSAIQLVALAAPLCTQVVIDKVIVHQTLNTLAVIALAHGIVADGTAVEGAFRRLSRELPRRELLNPLALQHL
jgi:ABC-type bacteriocin/lantibiotic exporter with double-glycine peptidase domain